MRRLLLVALLAATAVHAQDRPYDIVIRHGTVIDGTGRPRLAADVAIKNGFIAAVGTDAENVYTVLTARVMRPDLFIIARVEADDAERKLRQAGASRVISPYHIGANHMVQTALRPAVVDFVHVATSSANLDLSMEQVQVRDGSAMAGKSLIAAGIRQQFGVIVVSIKDRKSTRLNSSH